MENFLIFDYLKVYRARSEIAINIRVEGSVRHVVFVPLCDGGSVFPTADPAVQRAIESHPRFGRLFTRDKRQKS